MESGLLAAIGNTPLVRLTRLERDVPGLELYGKLEASNPGGSVKDRAARHMILEGMRSGALGPGKRLLDATSGNTGIAYAMLGAALGFPVTLCLPGSASPERKRILTAYGAELVFTDPMDGSDGAIVEARRRYAATPEQYFYPDQYNNDFNWRAHFETTGPEILAETAGRITHFVAALGTSGTFMGTGRFLRANIPDVVLISVQPESPLHGLEGLKHMASAIVPGIYDATLADYAAEMSTEAAHEMTQAPGARGGIAGGRVERRQRRGRADACRRRAAHPRSGRDGGRALRRRRSLSLRALLGRGTDPRGRGGPALGDLHDMTPLTLGPGVRAAIEQHGREAYPHECCGALLGDGDVVHAVHPLPNVTTEGPRRRFRVDDKDYLAAERKASAAGLSLLGFYHSHPDHPAEPSQYDLDHAFPTFVYPILSVQQGEPAALRAWRLRADRSGYDEQPVDIPAAAAAS